MIFSLYFTTNIFACCPLINILFMWRKKSLAGNYLTDARRAEPVFRLFHTVQRIAYPQPVDWEIIVGTENPITEHRIVQVPEFDQDTAARCFLCEMFEHIAEDFFCLFFVGRKRLVQKFAFTIYYTMFH